VAITASLGFEDRSTAAINWPSLIETVLAVAAIASTFPQFDRLAIDDAGRGGRFADAAISVGGLPERVLASLCASHGALAEPMVRDRLCRRAELRTEAAATNAIPLSLVNAYAESARAFRRPLAEAEKRRGELRLQQREGLGDLLSLGNEIEAIDAEVAPYAARYALAGSDDAAPLPLACAFDRVKSAIAGPGGRGETASANALLLLGAALDGHGATPALAEAALLPASPRSVGSICGSLPLTEALSRASLLIADARQARMRADKNEAMRDLLHTAGWQWAAWMLAGLVLVKLARRPGFALIGVALALSIWAAAALIGRVPWPFAAGFEPGRVSASITAAPAPFVLALLGAAIVTLIASLWLQKRTPGVPQTLASRIGYPGLVAASGLGWLLLLDLSANGNFSNRYLALYHQGHLWLGMLVLTVMAFLRQDIGRALGWTLSMLDALMSYLRRSLGSLLMIAAALALVAGAVAAVGVLANRQQISSELARLCLIIGVAWFFFLRGGPLAQRLAHSGGSLASLLRYVWPLLCVVLVVIAIQLIARYLGPLLIACYGAGAFVAASIAMWWRERSGAGRAAFALAMLLFVSWIVGTTIALFQLGSLHEITAGRLENLAAPLASANDQLALVTWFQRAAPPDGFGVGSVPWCGNSGASSCAGVPAQIQSDYTLTALVGAFGWTIAWIVVIGGAIWLHRLIRHHGRVTRGEPRLVAASEHVVNDDQALISWIGVAWVVLALCQLAVTVAGNLAVLPLTGVTFPFVSFGMTSLVANMAMLGLVINVNVSPRGARG
jgi:cell division protein FtsW (lipid II flippase)